MKRSLHTETLPLPGFQIAPMIDVIFVIMLFFMVLAATTPREGELALKLPHSQLWTSDIFHDEAVTLGVLEDGSVTMNDEIFDSATSTSLPQLTQTLHRLAVSTQQQRSRVLVTIQAEPAASYQRVIDVLNALGRASIVNVTFEVSGSE